MTKRALRGAGLVATVVAVASLGSSLLTAQTPRTLVEFGDPVYPAYEGWFPNEDGTFTILIGFFNPNGEETLEVPVGDENYLSPGPQDQGQPTHFPPGRHWGVFSIQVPADFGDENITWHLTTNGRTIDIPFALNPPYFVEPFKDAANNNEPPTVRFSAAGEGYTGPPLGIAHSLTASVGVPLPIPVWTSDVKPDQHVREREGRFRRPAQEVAWERVRGPAAVEFDEAVHEYEDSSENNPTTSVTFSEPGTYLLRVQVLDETGPGGSGFQCCWTSALVSVEVS